MPSEPRWLTPAEVVQLNQEAVAATREPFAVLSDGLLEGACYRPINLYHYEREEDIVPLAAALLLGIVRNHPFQQGNKRTAYAATDAFLFLNGYELVLPDEAIVAEMIVDAIAGAVGDREIEAMISNGLRPIGSPRDSGG